MAVFSELSILELDAERGELLPEREALQTIDVSFGAVTQANVATPTATQTSTGAGAQAITQTVSQSAAFTPTVTAVIPTISAG